VVSEHQRKSDPRTPLEAPEMPRAGPTSGLDYGVIESRSRVPDELLNEKRLAQISITIASHRPLGD
jgi:hypothetical protein